MPNFLPYNSQEVIRASGQEMTPGGDVALRTTLAGSNAQVDTDKTATWANNAVANTTIDVDFALPSSLQGDALYLVTIYNPSTVTALTVVAKIRENALGGADRFPELTRWGVSANSSKSVLVQGWMLGAASRLTLSNDTALGAADGFTASIRVRKV